MKKLPAFLLACSCLVFGALFATSCNKKYADVNENNGEIYAVYTAYVAYAEENGIAPLSYEEWLASIKGEQGVGVKDAFIDSNGDLIIKLTNNEIINAGHIINDENPQGLDFYLQDDGTYAVSGGNAKCLSNIIIPSSYKGKAVTKILSYAFEKDSDNVKNIIIPDSVTSIGHSAFNGCYGLTSVNIPDGVTSIGDGAFYGCSGLTSITIPDSVTSIGYDAFYKCSGLTSITIPDSVTSIGYGAFRYCIGLTSVTIPDSVKSIGSNAFPEQLKTKQGGIYYVDTWVVGVVSNSLSTATIKDGTKGIADSAFSGCSSLTSITIPDSVTSIGDAAFADCSGLTSVTIPDSVTSIGRSAFSNCSGLTSITIPDSVTSIGYYAFYNCSGLTSVTIGNGVTSIEFEAFNGCSALTSVYYNGTESEWQDITISYTSWSNSNLLSASRYYYSEEEPTESGNFWHYDADGITPVIWAKDN